MSMNMIVLRLLETGALTVEEAQKLIKALQDPNSTHDLILPVDGLKRIELEYEISDNG